MKKLCVIATHNEHKCRELARILEPLGFEVLTDRELGRALPEVEETGDTFAENAYLKAESACRTTGIAAIADDSGLMVDALSGAPGVYSARYAGEYATAEECNRKLLAALKMVPDKARTARFVCHICCVFPDGRRVDAEGTCEGMIGRAPRGENGFGYDPLFFRGERSFAELSTEEKDAVSHRGVALRCFAARMAQMNEVSTTTCLQNGRP